MIGREVSGDGGQILGAGHKPARAQLGPAARDPTMDAHPVQFTDVAFDEALKPVIHAKHRVAFVDAKAHCDARGRVHARRWPAGMQHSQAQLSLLRIGRMRLGPHQSLEDAEGLGEAAAAQRHGLLVVLVCNDLGYQLGLSHGRHERRANGPVLAQSDQLGFAVGRGGQDFVDRIGAQDRAVPAVERAGCAATLDVAQDRDARVLAEAVVEHLLDLLGVDGVAVAVAGAFGDDDDVVAAAGFAAGPEGFA